MKRTLVIMLTLTLMLAFSSTVSADQTQKASVCELYSVDGFYEDDLGNQSTYSFHIPQINADTPDAEEINKEIAEEFGTLAEDQFENMKNGLSLIFGKVDWDAYWNGDQLFLLLTSDTPGEIINYAAYGYDFENGCRVTNEMILEQKGISEEEYIEELKESVRGMFDDIVTIPEGMETELDVDEMLAHTLNRLDMEQPMFINQYGEIVTIVQIDLVAGAGYNNYLAVTFSEK